MVKRGELYRVEKPTTRDPKGFRVVVIVSRQEFIETRYASVICAPIYTNRNDLPTEIYVGIEEGLKHDSAIRCDELISIQKYKLTNFIATLSKKKIQELNQALKIALEIDD